MLPSAFFEHFELDSPKRFSAADAEFEIFVIVCHQFPGHIVADRHKLIIIESVPAIINARRRPYTPSPFFTSPRPDHKRTGRPVSFPRDLIPMLRERSKCRRPSHRRVGLPRPSYSGAQQRISTTLSKLSLDLRFRIAARNCSPGFSRKNRVCMCR